MQIAFYPTPIQWGALEYYASNKKERKKNNLKKPSRNTRLELLHEGVLGSWWLKSERKSIWYRGFFLPDDIKPQMDQD